VFQQFHGEVILDHNTNEGSCLFLEITFSGGRDETRQERVMRACVTQAWRLYLRRSARLLASSLLSLHN
jgi:hypothetical protein